MNIKNKFKYLFLLVLTLSSLLSTKELVAKDYLVTKYVVTSDEYHERGHMLVFLRLFNPKTFILERIIIRYCVRKGNEEIADPEESKSCVYIGPPSGYNADRILVSQDSYAWASFLSYIAFSPFSSLVSIIAAPTLVAVLDKVLGYEYHRSKSWFHKYVNQFIDQVFISIPVTLIAYHLSSKWAYKFYFGVSENTIRILSGINYGFELINERDSTLYDIVQDLIVYANIPKEFVPDYFL